MVNPFICGNFHHQQQEDDDMETMSQCSTIKRSKRHSLSRTRDIKNPYADRGLDKFSALLADLEDKKQKIYTQIGSDEISILRFAYSNSNDVKPIIVKLKEPKQSTSDTDDDKQIIHEAATPEIIHDQERKIESKRMVKNRVSWNLIKWESLKRPAFYLPLMIILILVFLAIYGKSFAVLCTSIMWYLIPTITSSSSSSSSRTRTSTKMLKKKNEYVKRVINEGSNSPTSVMNGPIDRCPFGKHGHKNSW